MSGASLAPHRAGRYFFEPLSSAVPEFLFIIIIYQAHVAQKRKPPEAPTVRQVRRQLCWLTATQKASGASQLARFSPPVLSAHESSSATYLCRADRDESFNQIQPLAQVNQLRIG